jgi:hypothetical protein
MRVTIKYGSYNQRRYSRPWIALVTAWPIGSRPELKWGGYVGGDDGGECEIEASEGDVLKSGQKDGRGNGGSNDFYVVESGKAVCVNDGYARETFDKTTKEKAAGKLPQAPFNSALALLADAQLIDELKARGYTVTK